MYEMYPGSGRSHGEAGISPSRHPALHGLDPGKTLLLILFCLTGGRILVGSGAIKNNLLVLGQGRDLGEKFGGQECPGQLHVFTVFITGIGTDQETLSGFYPRMALYRRYSGDHDIFPV
jgi:hypothetical protein